MRLLCSFIVVINAYVIVAQSQLELRIESEFVLIPKPSLEGEEIRIYKGCITRQDVRGMNPVSGELNTWKDSLRFEPIVPFSNDQDYSIVMKDTVLCFQLKPPDDYTHIAIEQIFPSSNKIPANFLKWYIQFSRPVNPANIYNHFALLDTDGQVVDRAFINFEYALLNDQRDVLTLWVEPGRQKRDLGPNLDLGPVFTPGEKYELLIDKNLKDDNGIAMGSDWRHQFYVTKNERNEIDLQDWIIIKPRHNTKDALTIQLEKPLDFGSFTNVLSIRNETDILVEGRWLLKDYEQTIVFEPDRTWKRGGYIIYVNDTLEDLAGNRINRLFDQPISNVRKDQIVPSNSIQFKL